MTAMTGSAGTPPDHDAAEPVGVQDLKSVMGHFATGVAVVTAMEDAGPVGVTCQTFLSLSLDPPLVALAPSKSSTSWPKIRAAGQFCVNILASSQVRVCRAFARSGGYKFEGVEWVQGLTGSPVILGSLAWVECRLELAHDAGDHELIVGRVVSLAAGEGEPLLYYRSQFASIGPAPGV